jgi:hypothetical protein
MCKSARVVDLTIFPDRPRHRRAIMFNDADRPTGLALAIGGSAAFTFVSGAVVLGQMYEPLRSKRERRACGSQGEREKTVGGQAASAMSAERVGLTKDGYQR